MGWLRGEGGDTQYSALREQMQHSEWTRTPELCWNNNRTFQHCYHIHFDLRVFPLAEKLASVHSNSGASGHLG